MVNRISNIYISLERFYTDPKLIVENLEAKLLNSFAWFYQNAHTKCVRRRRYVILVSVKVQNLFLVTKCGHKTCANTSSRKVICVVFINALPSFKSTPEREIYLSVCVSKFLFTQASPGFNLHQTPRLPSVHTHTAKVIRRERERVFESFIIETGHILNPTGGVR